VRAESESSGGVFPTRARAVHTGSCSNTASVRTKRWLGNSPGQRRRCRGTLLRKCSDDSTEDYHDGDDDEDDGDGGDDDDDDDDDGGGGGDDDDDDEEEEEEEEEEK